VLLRIWGGEDVCTTESPSSREPPIEVEAAFAHESSMLDIALTECLQDMCFAILAVSYLCVRCWVFTFSCFCIQSVKLTKATKTIIAGDSGASLCHCIVDMEAEKDTLQCVVDK
jgi:hypothetical protein